MDIKDRIRKLSAIDAVTDCWVWLGSVGSSGYGHLKVSRRTRSAARVSFEVFVGPLADGFEPDHLCRNRRCVNPQHLEAVTRAENLRRRNIAQPIATHCKNGHELSAVRTRKEGGRYCRICVRDSKRRQRLAKKAA